jgi:hypothetical protein
MIIFKFIQCLFHGHSNIDITNSNLAYSYCLRCGKVKGHGHIVESQVIPV